MEEYRVRAAAVVAAALALSGTAYGAAAGDVTGTYWVTEYHPKLVIVGGGELPLNAMGKEAYAHNQAGLKSGEIIDKARIYCVPDGVPRLMGGPYPFEILDGPPTQMTMIFELNHQVRTIDMDKPPPTDAKIAAYPYFNGHSVGHYEGDTLVLQTNGYNGVTYLDATGAPHSDDMTTVERFRKTDANHLEDLMTIHDPDYYTKDFQVRYLYAQRNDVRLQDYVCNLPHRDISAVPGVAAARANEQRAAAK